MKHSFHACHARDVPSIYDYYMMLLHKLCVSCLSHWIRAKMVSDADCEPRYKVLL